MDTNDLPLEVREVPEGEDLRQRHALIGTDLVLIKRPTAPLAKLDGQLYPSSPPRNTAGQRKSPKGIGHWL